MQNILKSIKICNIPIKYAKSYHTRTHAYICAVRQNMHMSCSTCKNPYRECAYFKWFVSKCGIFRNHRWCAYV